MKRINLLCIFIMLSTFLFGCDDSGVDSSSNRSDVVEYNITASLCTEALCGAVESSGDSDPYGDNLTYIFGVASNGSDITDNETYSVVWNFGDGSDTEDNLTAIHTYLEEGTYTVLAYITNIEEETVTNVSVTLLVGQEVDLYSNEIKAYSQSDRRAFQLISTAISSSGQSLKYSWDFNDGTASTLSKRENAVTHTFPRYGTTYNVSVTVDNGLGKENSRVTSTIALETYLPSLAIICGSGGPYIDDNGSVSGQYLVCNPELTYGSVPDIAYTWKYYSEITQDEYNSLLNDTEAEHDLVILDNDREVTSCSSNSCIYYQYDGEGRSDGSEQMSFMYSEGGRKYIKASGSSFYYFANGKEVEAGYSIYLPSNSYLGIISCSEDTEDESGLTYNCSALAYALPKIDNESDSNHGKTYAIPLRIQNWSVYDQDNVSREYDTLSNNVYCVDNDGAETETEIDEVNGEYSTTSTSYDSCYATVTYKAKRYDGVAGDLTDYSIMKLNTGHYEVINDNITDTVEQSTFANFQVVRPSMESVSCESTGSLLEYECTAQLSKTLTNTTGVTYYWTFGDGAEDTTSSGNVTHTYSVSSSYPVTVYAIAPDLWDDATDTATTTITPANGINTEGSVFSVERISDNKSGGIQTSNEYGNTYLITSSKVLQLDGINVDNITYTLSLKAVNSNVIGIWDNKTYSVEFTIPDDNITKEDDKITGFSYVTGIPTFDNVSTNMYEGKPVLAIPYGEQIQVTLKVTSPQLGDDYSWEEVAYIDNSRVTSESSSILVGCSSQGPNGSSTDANYLVWCRDFSNSDDYYISVLDFGDEFMCSYRIRYYEQGSTTMNNADVDNVTMWVAGNWDNDTNLHKYIDNLTVPCNQKVCIGSYNWDNDSVTTTDRIRVYVSNGPYIYDGNGVTVDNTENAAETLIHSVWRTGKYKGTADGSSTWSPTVGGSGDCDKSNNSSSGGS